MLRLWVTLYYGYWLLGLAKAQQQTPLNENPSSVWWKGSSVTFVKYRNDGSCRQIAVNSSVPNFNDINGYVGFNQNGAWFGGADRITFKMDGTSCVRVSTHRGEWVQMTFQSGHTGCSVGANSVMGDLRYYDHPECRTNEHRNQVSFMDMGGAIMLDGINCFYDRGTSPNPPFGQVFYRAFCDVTAPLTQQIFPKEEKTVFVTNNLTTTVVQPHFITNNITTFVPSIIHTNVTTYVTTFVPTTVKPDDLIPLIQQLMAKNASIFRVLSAPLGSDPTLTAPNNKQPKSSATTMVPLFVISHVIYLVLLSI